jgi:lysophospholipase L1-like esterase
MTPSDTRNFATWALAAFAAAHLACAQGTNDHWVGTWATAPQLTEPNNLPPPPGLTSNTLRQVVHVSIGGNKLRLRFSNAFGSGPVTINSAHLAKSDGGSVIRPESDSALTFRDQSSVTVPPGKMIFSDPFAFELSPLSDVTVTIHFGGTATNVTGHPGSRTTSYLHPGNWVSATELTSASKTQHWFILAGIDVLADSSSAAVVTLGDSITDGRGSVTDQNNRWPDNLARRLQANPDTQGVAVMNQGIGGNCVLRGGLGPTALGRFERDVLAQNGVRWLIVLEGVNDIGGARGSNATAVATELIAAFDQMIQRAHDHNIRIFGGTILPFAGSSYFSPKHEAARQTVNDWIRTSAKFDSVIDFEAAMRDPQNSSCLAAAADSGDHLHPGVKGYQLMADAIDLKLFGMPNSQKSNSIPR